MGPGRLERVFWMKGSEAGEASYTELANPGEIVWVSDARKVRVVDVIEEQGAVSSFGR